MNQDAPPAAGSTTPFPKLRARVAAFGPVASVLYTGMTAFALYSCMYSFRKGITAESYDAVHYFGVPLKVYMLSSQLFGYMLSKVYGIRFIGELGRERRHLTVIGLIFASWVALLLFGVTPAPYCLVFMFLNGLPLGLVWGVVFSYLEGRRTTELLGGILATSMIFSAGFARTCAMGVMAFLGANSAWMPFVTGALFFIPVVVLSFMMELVPPPDADDVKERSLRKKMTAGERRALLRVFAAGLAPAITLYVLISVLRDIRDSFSFEIWKEAGYGDRAAVFTVTESLVAFVVLAAVALFFRVRDSFLAFRLAHVAIALGIVISAATSLMLERGMIGPYGWMIGTGVGLYTGYIVFTCVYFERLIAAYRIEGNVGFLIYVADSIGYFGAIVVLVAKELFSENPQWIRFLGHAYGLTCVTGLALIAFAYAAFVRLHRKRSLTREDGPHEALKPFPEAL